MNLSKRELVALEILKQFVGPANMFSPEHFKEASKMALQAADIFLDLSAEEDLYDTTRSE